jgi:glutamyl-tRNA reductase
VELRERLAVDPESLGATSLQLVTRLGVREAMLLATCNRVEAYVVADHASACVASLKEFFEERAPGGSVESCLYQYADDAATRHMFRVASSLESMVVGEPQILGQVKEAFAAAQHAGAVGPRLQQTVSRAFQAAKRVRTETGLSTGRVSVASVAVDLASQIFGSLDGTRVLLIGAGKMALGAAKSLTQKGAKLSIANRNYDRAVELARARAAVAHPLDDVALLLTQADVVLCSTGASRFVLTVEMVRAAMKVRRGRSLFVVDIAVPRNVDPTIHSMDGVYLFDVDDLEREVGRALNARGGSLQDAERIVEEELLAFARDRRVGVGAGPTIAALREHFRVITKSELERSLSGKLKSIGPAERLVLDAMLDSIVNKLLHKPTMALRNSSINEQADAMAAVVRALFALDAADDEKK